MASKRKEPFPVVTGAVDVSPQEAADAVALVAARSTGPEDERLLLNVLGLGPDSAPDGAE